MSEPRVVASVAIAVASNNLARKQQIEAAARQAVLDAIAASEKAGTGFPSDGVLREVQLAAIARERGR